MFALRVLQVCVIVDEVGTEAAAVSVDRGRARCFSREQPPEIKLNRWESGI